MSRDVSVAALRQSAGPGIARAAARKRKLTTTGEGRRAGPSGSQNSLLAQRFPGGLCAGAILHDPAGALTVRRGVSSFPR